LDDDGYVSTAAAFHEPRKECPRAPSIPYRNASAFGLHGPLTRPYLFPKDIIDDAQIGHLGDHPVRFRVQTRYTFACLRILHIAQPVPDLAADIEFIV